MLKHTSFFIGSFALVVAITLGASQSANPTANPTATPTTPQSDTQDSSQKSAKPKRGPGLRYGIADAPKKTKAIRLAAYNIQNFFDRVDDPKLSGEWDDMKLAITDDRAEALAKVIHRLDADVLFLEEVESKEALTWFRDTYLKDMGYVYLESLDAGYYRGVEQSVLSRFPTKNPRVFLDTKLSTASADDNPEDSKPTAGSQEDASNKVPEDKTKFQRSPLAVDIEFPDGYMLTAYAIHHKAGGEKFNDHREAEAKKIIEFVKADMAKNPDANVVIVGDFNSTPLSSCRKLYKDAGLLNGYDYRSVADRNKQEKDKSISETERDALRDRYTTHESGRPIDYIILSPGFANEIVPGSYFVLSTLHPGDAYDWKKDKPPAGYASDHYPIAIEFTPKDAKPKDAKSKDGKSKDGKSKDAKAADSKAQD